MATATPAKINVGEALAKIKLTPTEQALVRCCVMGKAQKTIEQISEDYGRAIKKVAQPDSVRSKLSTIRTKFKVEGGIVFPAAWEPKGDGPGGGRRVERVDVMSALNGLDFGDLELEVAELPPSVEDDDKDDDEAAE